MISTPIRYLIFISIAIVYVFGMLTDIMDVDAAQYASLSVNMLKNGNWLHFCTHDWNYLDKPPLIFWTSAVSYSIFGISNFSYKLPSVLASIMGIWSTYRFTKLYYSELSAYFSSVILATCEAYFLFNSDVKTDPLLTNFVIFSTYHLAAYLLTNKKINFVLAFVGIGFAMLAKGPIGLMTIVFAFGPHLLAKRDFSTIFNLKWLLGIVIILVVLAPMCYGLYTQYGLYGLRFFFWTQSFGRITGESNWVNHMGPLFIFHSFLWAFLPWTVFVLIGVFLESKMLWIQKFKISNNQEIIALSGLMFSYLSLEQSKYELPHYIWVVMPFASIIAANFLVNINEKYIKTLQIIQTSVCAGIFIITGLITFYVFDPEWYFGLIYGFSLGIFFGFIFKQNGIKKIFIITVVAIISLNLLLFTHFFPKVLYYQPGHFYADYIQKNNIPKNKVYNIKGWDYPTDFYAQYEFKNLNSLEEVHTLPKGKIYAFVNEPMMEYYKTYYDVKVLLTRPFYHVSKLTPKFLNPATRESTIRKSIFVEIYLK